MRQTVPRHVASIALLAAACGGEVSAPDVVVQPDAAPDVRANAEPDADRRDGAPQCTGPQLECVRGCGSDIRAQAVCVDGTWTCPAGAMQQSDCPVGGCVYKMTDDVCCAPDRTFSNVLCSDWSRNPTLYCPSGTVRMPPADCQQCGLKPGLFCVHDVGVWVPMCTDGAWQCLGADECPAAVGCADASTVVVYAKSPSTGACCQYGLPCGAPVGWTQFTTMAACRAAGSADAAAVD